MKKNREKHNTKNFSHMETIPNGVASEKITKGCIVLEGGAFRGMYSEGVLDFLMEQDINFECSIGVSAGAMNAMNYISGQIGRSARVNLEYRHDRRYVGWDALKHEKGFIGFDYVFHELSKIYPFDEKRFFDTSRRFLAVATSCETGEPVYLDRDACSDAYKAIQASASMPVVSQIVEVDGIPCLDGGCSNAIPYQWAIDEGYEKIIVVRTRPKTFRKTKDSERMTKITRRIYSKYPKLVDALAISHERYNKQCEELEQLEQDGRIFVVAPSAYMDVSRLERDMEKLGIWYSMGYQDMQFHFEELKKYLAG